jgi:hypothetical protein
MSEEEVFPADSETASGVLTRGGLPGSCARLRERLNGIVGAKYFFCESNVSRLGTAEAEEEAACGAGLGAFSLAARPLLPTNAADRR